MVLASSAAWGGSAVTAGSGGGGASGSASSVSISAMGAPMGMVSPSWASTLISDPATGEGTSMVTLSVITSTSGS